MSAKKKESKTTRRGFLFGRSLLGKLRSVAEKAVSGAGLIGDNLPRIENVSQQSWPLLQISRSAMATDFEVSLNRGQYPQGTEAALEALDEVDRLEKLLSVFRPESLVSHINDHAAEEPIAIDDELFELLSLSRVLSEETCGAIDVTSSQLWRVWGFAKQAGRVPEQREIEEALACTGSQFLFLDKQSQTVHFTHPKTEISFGCIGKGFALDVAAKRLEELEVNDFLFHGGKSSILARGGRMQESWPLDLDVPSVRDRSIGWTIGVADPIHQGSRIAEIRLTNEALGTSGSQQQFFRYRGKRYSHILDPRTGHPAESVSMVTVVAPTAVLADALSTAFFVLGPEKTEEYCRNHQGIAALLVVPAKHENGYELCSFGFEANQIRFLI